MFSEKKVYDVTRPIQNGMTVWPGDDGVTIERVMAISGGAVVNVSRAAMGVHAGTHMDAPLHFIDGGDDIAHISIGKLMGEVLVVETNAQVIDETCLEELDTREVSAVFFKTECSNRDGRDPFLKEYPAITESCAKTLIDRGIQTVGVDYFSIELFSDSQFSVHRLLLANKTAIVENLCLAGIEPGKYSFISLPLKIDGSDGSPCRVLLFK